MSHLDHDAHIKLRDEGIRIVAHTQGRSEGYAEGFAAGELHVWRSIGWIAALLMLTTAALLLIVVALT